MDDDAARAFAQSILEPGETLLWSEAAPAWPIFSGGFFGALFCAGFFIMLSMMMSRNGPAPGVPRWLAAGAVLIFQICCCFGFVGGVVQTAGAWSTAYAITNQRVIIASRYPWLDVRAYGEPDIVYYVIKGHRLSFADRPGRRRIFTDLNDLENPEQAMALIRANIAPFAQPY